jgi:hypothetical protein
MILRFSQKLGSRLKAGPLKPKAADTNPLADWTAHVFYANRTPYILVSNTPSLYSIVLFAKGIPDDSRFITRTLWMLRESMERDGLADAYHRFVVPETGLIYFASALNRSVTGSMNELIESAKTILLLDEPSTLDLSSQLNDLLLSTLARSKAHRYGKPREAFLRLIAESESR